MLLLNENIHISIEIPLKFIPNGPINNIPALAQITDWRRPGVNILIKITCYLEMYFVLFGNKTTTTSATEPLME